jgi:HSP20 family protein
MAIVRWTPEVDYVGGYSAALQRNLQPYVNSTIHLNPMLTPYHGLQSELPTQTAIPPVDLIDQQNEFIVRADVPGVDPTSLKIMVANNILTIRGERTQDREWKPENYFWTERTAGMFQRSITLPVSVDPNDVRAFCENGILTVRLPKSEEATSVQVGIQGALSGFGNQTLGRNPSGRAHSGRTGSRKSKGRIG